jgi:pimeloyl-ACP methyl ester carboxylesterase
VIEPEALARIATYVGLDPTFASFAEIERYIRTVSAPFGPLTDAQWQHLTVTNVRQRADGRWGLAYDPGIAVPFRAAPAPADLWGLWDAIRCSTLVLRGAASDLLSAATAAEMRSRGPRPEVLEFAGVGHAPMLLDPPQVAPVVAFLRRPAPPNA